MPDMSRTEQDLTAAPEAEIPSSESHDENDTPRGEDEDAEGAEEHGHDHLAEEPAGSSLPQPSPPAESPVEPAAVVIRVGSVEIRIPAEIVYPAGCTGVEADPCGIEAVHTGGGFLAMESPLEAEALRAKPKVVAVKADRFGGGYEDFQLRPDLAPSYRAVYDRVRALGGVVTSSGAIRYLEASVGPARSPTSLHYTGRALDLFVKTAMQGESDPYIVVREGGTDANPRWHLYCVSTTPDTASPLFDPALIQERELAATYWSKTAHTLVTRPRRARCFSLTTIFRENGWVPIAARASWRKPEVESWDRYLSTEWFHFQNQSGLVEGKTKFGDELRKVWSAEDLARSGLALGAVWRGQSFKKV